MNVLVINAGSSSIKFQLINMPSAEWICDGIIERIGQDNAVLKYKTKAIAFQSPERIPTHKEGLKKMVEWLLDPEKGVITDKSEIEVVGHRVVHGGNSFSAISLIDTEVKEQIQAFSALAPLHNPNNLQGIILAEKLFPAAKQVAVFDTAYHQTIPEKAKKYAIPGSFYKDQNIQVYGFHGTSHKYVSEKAIEYLRLKKSKIISIHLGSGCSITAILNGKSIDHSLGFAPSNGLIMGSRSGDIDHSIVFYLVNDLGYSLDKVNTLLTKESGMLGLTGYSDFRDVQREAENGNPDCSLALEMNAYRIKKYIGAYIAAMNGLDAIVFTAGVGENSSLIRKLVCIEMDVFGIHLDDAKNEADLKDIREIHELNSKVKILVVPTNEELEIAKQAYDLIGQED